MKPIGPWAESWRVSPNSFTSSWQLAKGCCTNRDTLTKEQDSNCRDAVATIGDRVVQDIRVHRCHTPKRTMTKALQSPPAHAALLREIKGARPHRPGARRGCRQPELPACTGRLAGTFLTGNRLKAGVPRFTKRLAKDLGAEFRGIEGLSRATEIYEGFCGGMAVNRVYATGGCTIAGDTATKELGGSSSYFCRDTVSMRSET